MEAIRQDKIGHILTLFRTEGIRHESPSGDPLDCLIASALSNLTHCNIQSISIERLHNLWGSYENMANAELIDIANCLISAKFQIKKASTIKSILSWVYSNFGKYSLEPIRTWKDDQIISNFRQIEGVAPQTIAVMMCLSLDRDIFPVDAHVYRIFTRIGVSSRSWDSSHLYIVINQFIPFGKSCFLYRNLVEFGRKVCRTNDPQCSRCLFSNICDLNLTKNDWALR